MTIPLRTRLRGIVAAYDDHAGIGDIEATGPGDAVRFPFHCTRIADGSRHVDPGQEVTFRVVPGHSGCWEAADVEKGPR